MKRKNLILLILILLICCIITIAAGIGGYVFYISNLNKQVQNNIVTPGLPPVNVNDTSVKYKIVDKNDTESSAVYDINVTYPQIEGYSDAKVQEDFNQYAFDSVNQDIKAVKFGDDSIGKNTLSYSYEVKYSTDKFISILMKGSQYMEGAAHPNTILITINYDLKNNKPLSLADMFNSGSNYLTQVANYSKDSLTSQLGDALEESGITPTPDNFKNFYFSKDTLTIIFSSYQVGPYAIGTPEVKIPFSKIDSILKADFK